MLKFYGFPKLLPAVNTYRWRYCWVSSSSVCNIAAILIFLKYTKNILYLLQTQITGLFFSDDVHIY